ncbi:MAG: carbohydrate kinase family protein [Bacillota bacterium]
MTAGGGVPERGTAGARLVAIGDVLADVVARTEAGLAGISHGSDTPATIVLAPGGSAANFAVRAARLGADCALIGAVGDDRAGRWLLEDLRGEGVDTAGVAVLPVTDAAAEGTGMLVSLVDPSGERSMLVHKGANRRLRAEHVPAGFFSAPGILHLTGYTFFEEGPRAAAMWALALAREAGWRVSLDPSSRAPLIAHGSRRLLEDTAPLDYILPNRDEATTLTAEGDPEKACRALLRWAGVVAVKLGPDGCLLAVRAATSVTHVPAPVPLVAADSTGAGDAFDAGFLAAVARGVLPREAAAAGNRAAADVVRVLGAR